MGGSVIDEKIDVSFFKRDESRCCAAGSPVSSKKQTRLFHDQKPTLYLPNKSFPKSCHSTIFSENYYKVRYQSSFLYLSLCYTRNANGNANYHNYFTHNEV